MNHNRDTIKMMHSVDISVVVPVYNEEAVLEQFCNELITVLDQMQLKYEVLLVDDGSRDLSWTIIRNQSRIQKGVKAIRLSRNFGQQIALTAGLDAARGKAIVFMDADLQHPPTLIPKMVDAWKKGALIVKTVRQDQRLPIVKRYGTALFYSIFRTFSHVPLDRSSPDFRLLDASVAKQLQTFKERDRFMRGLINWMGYPYETIEFIAPEQPKKRSRYTVAKMIHLALDGFTSFTAIPLRLAFYSGLIVSVISASYAFYALYVKFAIGSAVQGWTSLLITVLFLGGCQMVFLGIIGEYLLRIYNEVKHRPLYIALETAGYEECPKTEPRI